MDVEPSSLDAVFDMVESAPDSTPVVDAESRPRILSIRPAILMLLGLCLGCV